MSRWSIKPQVIKVEGVETEVDVKFGCHVPQERNGETSFMRLSDEQGWIAVHLAYKCHDGSEEVCRVHRTMKGNYIFHHPQSNENVIVQGKVTNVLNPETKKVKNTFATRTRSTMRDYIVQTTKNPELADHVLSLIDSEHAATLKRMADKKAA